MRALWRFGRLNVWVMAWRFSLSLGWVGVIAIVAVTSWAARDGANPSFPTRAISASADASPRPPADPSGDAAAAAADICATRLQRYVGETNPWGVSMTATYASRAEDVGVEDERIRGGSARSAFRDRAPDEFVALCYFDGSGFGLAQHREVLVGEGPTDRLYEAVTADGTPYLLQVGPRDGVAVRDPSARTQ